MRRIFAKIFIVIAILSFTGSMYAYDFMAGNLYYTITNQAEKLVEVSAGDVKYRGDVVIPNTVTNGGVTYTVSEIGWLVFKQSTELTSIVLNDNIKEISANEFQDCTNLVSVSLGSGLEKIGGRAFLDCTSLSSINLNDNIVDLGGEVFNGCSSLTHAVIGSNYSTSGGSNFRNCINLQTIEIHNGAKVIGESEFRNCTSLRTVEIPNSVIELGSNAFQECKNLTTVKIGDGVQSISYHIFTECTRLKTLILGAGINEIGWRTAVNATQLESITCLNPNVPTLAEDAFATFAATVYVPSQSVSAYQVADVWKQFAAIKSYEEKVYLTIRQGDKGMIKQLANVGESYHYTILPENGWRIHSVTFNDEDVTMQLVDGTYTTPAMTENGILSVVYEQEGSDVRVLEANSVKVTGDSKGNIRISNLNIGETVRIYSMKGDLIHQFYANRGNEYLQMNTHGVYVVKVGNRSFKINI